jgi:hypothetical protein
MRLLRFSNWWGVEYRGLHDQKASIGDTVARVFDLMIVIFIGPKVSHFENTPP